MSHNNKQTFKWLILGIIIGTVLAFIYSSTVGRLSDTDKSTEAPKEPLYWVAPMDPNFRRDQPGQSPMGMDLIPYFGADDSVENNPGLVRISPHVINNLGVRTTSAEIRNVSSSISGVGLVKYNEEQLFHIHPRVEGWIEKLYIKSSGEPVNKNQALYDMYAPELVNAQEELLLALTRNNSRLIQAAEDRLQSLQFSSEQIKQLKNSRVTQQRVTFYSPHQGVVENLKIREGYFVDPKNTLMSIGALDDVWVEVDVLEKQSAMVKLNQSVDMTLDYAPGRIWQGQVDFIYPTLDPMTRNLKIRLHFKNEDHSLKPNMYAQVKINAIDDIEALVVPSEAVIRTGRSDRIVLSLGAGKFKSVEVSLGKQYDDFIEVIDGLVPGDEIVTSAQFLLDSESSKSSDFKRMNWNNQDVSHQGHSKLDHSEQHPNDINQESPR